MRRPWVRVARWLVAIVVGGAMIRLVVKNVGELRDVSLHVQPEWLLLAAPFTLFGGLLLPLAWRQVVGAHGAWMRVRTAIRIWCLAGLGRYLPTGLAGFAARIVLAAREGVPRAVVGSSLLIEQILIVGWALLLGAVLIPSDATSGIVRLLAGAIGLATVVLFPGLIPVGQRTIGRTFGRLAAIGENHARHRQLVSATAIFGLNDAVRTVAFVMLAFGLVDARWGDVALLAGSINLAAAAGLISISPSGLGVREAALAALLQQRFGFADAAALAICSRAWELGAEVIWTGVALVFARADTRATPSPDLDAQT